MKVYFFTFCRRIFASLLFIILTLVLQSQVGVTLSEIKSSEDEGVKCYNIELESFGNEPMNLAGQNYRLYYNTQHVLLKENSIKSFLPEHAYLPLKLVQHFFDMDASGFGPLPFERHLGFINLATDYNLTSGTPLVLSEGTTVKVAEMCFDVEANVEPEFVWSQDNLTHTYATAFVEIAKLEGERLLPAKIFSYKVKSSETTTSIQTANVFSVSVFPNPFTDRLTIVFNQKLNADARLIVRNIFGMQLMTQTLAAGSPEVTISGHEVPNGGLWIEIQSSDGQQSIMKAIKIK